MSKTIFRIMGLLAWSPLLFSLFCQADEISTQPDNRPNILLIITDQQRAGLLGCEGDRHIRTPALDRLAASGTRFELAYAANPVCVPSRVSMMTGRMPSYFGMRSNAEHRNSVPDGTVENAMGSILRRAGYQTVYGGKTHWLQGMTPTSIGFDLLTSDERDGLAEACSQFLREPKEQPFLLVASFINPHDICYMAIDDFTSATGQPTMYPQSKVERQRLAQAMQIPAGVSENEFFSTIAPPLPSNFEIPPHEPESITQSYVEPAGYLKYARSQWSPQRWRLYRWAYRRLMEMVDRQIGQVLTALDEAGLADSTVVIFTSDHGDMDAAHRMEHKSVLYEEAARVPLIIRDPLQATPFAVDQIHPVTVGLDLLPTLCDYAGVESPPDLAGQSLRGLINGDETMPARTFTVVESQAGRMVRTGRFKYVVYESGANRQQLIDLATDPGEMVNLVEDPTYAQVLAEHQRILHRWVMDTNDIMAKSYIVVP
jgi:arylsulfatase A-like enzyme